MKVLDSIRKNTIFLLLITIIVLYVILKDDFNGIVEAMRNIDIKYILVAILFYFLSLSIKGFANYLIINNKAKISLKEAIKHNCIAHFFNGITPFSTGGQPMEIYMNTEHGYTIAQATNQTVQSFIFYQIALVICGLFAVIYNFIFHLFPKVKLLQHLILIGFIINIIVAVVLLLISSSKVITSKISGLVIKILKLLKIKHNDKEIRSKFNDYYEGFQELKKRKYLAITGISLNIASLLCLYIVPLFILYSMGDFSSLSAVDTLSASAYVYVIGAFVPIPGASGGMEYGFTQFFGNFVSMSKLSATVIIWRFITYYLGLIIGGAMFSLEEKKVKK